MQCILLVCATLAIGGIEEVLGQPVSASDALPASWELLAATNALTVHIENFIPTLIPMDILRTFVKRLVPQRKLAVCTTPCSLPINIGM